MDFHWKQWKITIGITLALRRFYSFSTCHPKMNIKNQTYLSHEWSSAPINKTTIAKPITVFTYQFWMSCSFSTRVIMITFNIFISFAHTHKYLAVVVVCLWFISMTWQKSLLLNSNFKIIRSAFIIQNVIVANLCF